MPKVKNIENVAKIKEKLNRAKSLILTDYSGLTHKQLEELHKNLKKVGAEFLVVKNSLLKIASGEILKQVQDDKLKGPTGIFVNYDEDFAPLKELFKFVKIFSLPKVKMGVVNGITYDDKQIAALAAIPSRETLLTQLVYALNGNTRKFVYILSKINN